jgi:hypothetical protein
MKALIVVFAIAFTAFWLAKPIAALYMLPEDFARRRKVWLMLTVVAFISPNLWTFMLAAVPLYLWIGRKDSNPVAAYLLLMHVVPPVSADLPSIGSMVLFSMDNYRLLSFCVLVPLAIKALRERGAARQGSSRRTDWMVFAFGLLQIALFVPPDLANHVIEHDSATNMLRRAFLVTLDMFALYYAVSRSCNDRRKIVDAQAAFCLSAGIMALIATFEHFKGWLLYQGLAERWNPLDVNFMVAWLLRGDTWLRTQASSGHALSLAIMLSIAFGFWLYLMRHARSARTRLGPAFAFWAGLVSSFSRGPALGAGLIYLSYSALKPRAISRLFASGFVLTTVLAILAISPVGEKIMSSMPGMSSTPDETFVYRQRLLERTAELIQENPLFGDQLAMVQMEDLRQGQGIIDIVNTYVGVALFNGLVGLALFVGFILSAATAALRAAKATMHADPEHGLLGYNLLACIVGMAFMIADCSLIYGVEKTFYALIALAVAYGRLGTQPQNANGRPAADYATGAARAAA